MGAVLAPLLFILVLVVIGVYAMAAINRRQMTREDRAKRPGAETLRYRVPEGHDPVAVIAALQHEGFEAVEDHDAGFQVVLIPCPGGMGHDRERVRAAIGHAPVNLEAGAQEPHRVRFADE